jgi:hypothetical protein
MVNITIEYAYATTEDKDDIMGSSYEDKDTQNYKSQWQGHQANMYA